MKVINKDILQIYEGKGYQVQFLEDELVVNNNDGSIETFEYTEIGGIFQSTEDDKIRLFSDGGIVISFSVPKEELPAVQEFICRKIDETIDAGTNNFANDEPDAVYCVTSSECTICVYADHVDVYTEDSVKQAKYAELRQVIYVKDYISLISLAGKTFKMVVSGDPFILEEVARYMSSKVNEAYKAKTEGFDKVFGTDEKIVINTEKGKFFIKKGNDIISQEYDLSSITDAKIDIAVLKGDVKGAYKKGAFTKSALATSILVTDEKRKKGNIQSVGVIIMLKIGIDTLQTRIDFGNNGSFGLPKSHPTVRKQINEAGQLVDFLSQYSK